MVPLTLFVGIEKIVVSHFAGGEAVDRLAITKGFT